MDRPPLTGVERDVHFIPQDFEQFSKLGERGLGARPGTAPAGGTDASNSTRGTEVVAPVLVWVAQLFLREIQQGVWF